MPIHHLDSSRGQFTIVPNEIIADTRISALAKVALIHLLSKPANWHVMPAEMASVLGVSRRQIQRALAELIQAGYAQFAETKRHGAAIGRSYTIFAIAQPVAEPALTATNLSSSVTNLSPHGDMDVRDGDKSVAAGDKNVTATVTNLSSPRRQKCPASNTNPSNTELSNTDVSNTDPSNTHPSNTEPLSNTEDFDPKTTPWEERVGKAVPGSSGKLQYGDSAEPDVPFVINRRGLLRNNPNAQKTMAQRIAEAPVFFN